MATHNEGPNTPEQRYGRARAVWEKHFTGTTAIHYGYKQVSAEEQLTVAKRRAIADVAMGIMQRALSGMR
ncbi:hypothetical protein K2P56_04600 [Patescibacteria group bacterium]|nr:hypothetical protein [Patescibacteria group bacterium]